MSILTAEQFEEIRGRWPAKQTWVSMQALPDLKALLASHEALRALAKYLARELAYTTRHEDSCLESLGVHSRMCSCGYTHADKRAALADAREAGIS